VYLFFEALSKLSEIVSSAAESVPARRGWTDPARRTITGSTVRLQATVGDVTNPELRETLRAMYDSKH